MVDGEGKPIMRTARGTRNTNRASRKEYTEPKHKESAAARTYNEVGIYWDCADGETIENHGIPRESLTMRQHLKVWPQRFERETVKEQQRDSKTGKLVQTTSSRVTWKSDRSLLRFGKPDQFGGDKGTRFTRITSQSKRKTTELEYQTVVIESPADPIDLLD